MKWLIGLMAIAYISTGIYAIAIGDDFLDSMNAVWNDPWGKALMLDFILGQIIILGFIMREARKLPLWTLTIFLVGNVIGAIYFIKGEQKSNG